jgi:hypothetical protein
MRFENDFQRELYYTSQIDCCYFILSEFSKTKDDLRSPIEIMVDKVTGFDKKMLLDKVDDVIDLVKTIIRCKKKLEYDTDDDAKFLKELRNFKKSK